MAGEKRKPEPATQASEQPSPQLSAVDSASPEDSGPSASSGPPGDAGPKPASPPSSDAVRVRVRSNDPIASAVAILWTICVIGAVLYFSVSDIARFVDENYVYLGAAALGVAALPLFPKVGEWFLFAPATKQAAAIIFIAIPVIIGMLAGILLLDDHVRVPLIRLVFLFTVTLFPGLLYYLFIAARRDSLLNEFVGNLDRLGLLDRQAVATRVRPSEPASPLDDATGAAAEPDRLTWAIEPDESRNLRIRTYLERFEAIYGRLPDGLIERILEVTDEKRAVSPNDDGEEQRRSLFRGRFEWSNIFSTETTLPVLGATALIALGWIVTLPPFFGTLDPQQLDGWGVERLLSVELPAEQTAAAALGASEAGDTASAEAAAASNQSGFVGLAVPWSAVLEPLGATPVHFAFLGAYFFSLQMLFRRFVRRDLGPNAYLGVALRIVLAVVGVWVAIVALDALALSESLGQTGSLTFAFAVGAFPVIVWKLVSALTKNIPGMAVALPSLKSDLPLNKLSGLTVWHETRLEEEDVENVQNMATADIVDLMLHTRFPPDRIIAWVDEAMLYVHLGAEEVTKNKDGLFFKELRPRGIRNASTLVAAYERAKARGTESDFFAMASGQPNRLRVLIDTIATNPNLALIERWRGLLFPSLSAPRG